MKYNNTCNVNCGAAANAVPRFFFFFLFGALSFISTSLTAGYMQISPLRANIDNTNKNAIFDVINPSKENLSAQLQAVTWSQVNGVDVYKPTNDILAVPVLFKVPAGQKQTIRTALMRPNLSNKESSYRLILTEIPNPPAVNEDTPEGALPINLTMRIQLNIPVFVAPQNPIESNLEFVSSQNEASLKSKLLFKNSGNEHIQVKETTFTDINGNEETEVHSVYFLPGSTMTIQPESNTLSTIKKVSFKTDIAGTLEYDL